ncbi:hypothetical protein TNIN_432521 [Trichonephila inaurata madagascariensis]|uniref:Uncharacterized protein n=1 Tax=Trichonephila inaurata madagascariensis TaxID=2747483 RepID=A0A8X6YA88_9ARAC|nr:hypothetical protein TNIN_432521 [Trichonephila inaurata madagascariensis]
MTRSSIPSIAFRSYMTYPGLGHHWRSILKRHHDLRCTVQRSLQNCLERFNLCCCCEVHTKRRSSEYQFFRRNLVQQRFRNLRKFQVKYHHNIKSVLRNLFALPAAISQKWLSTLFVIMHSFTSFNELTPSSSNHGSTHRIGSKTLHKFMNFTSFG